MSQFTKANKLINWCIINWSSEAFVLWGPARGAVICVFTNSREHSAVLLNYILIQLGSEFKSQRPFSPWKECSSPTVLLNSRNPFVIESPSCSVLTSGRPLAGWLEWHIYWSQLQSCSVWHWDACRFKPSFTDFLPCPCPVERMSALPCWFIKNIHLFTHIPGSLGHHSAKPSIFRLWPKVAPVFSLLLPVHGDSGPASENQNTQQ